MTATEDITVNGDNLKVGTRGNVSITGALHARDLSITSNYVNKSNAATIDADSIYLEFEGNGYLNLGSHAIDLKSDLSKLTIRLNTGISLSYSNIVIGTGNIDIIGREAKIIPRGNQWSTENMVARNGKLSIFSGVKINAINTYIHFGAKTFNIQSEIFTHPGTYIYLDHYSDNGI